jgi:hypothetical protein
MGTTQSTQLLNHDFLFLDQVDHAEWYRIVSSHFPMRRLTSNCLLTFKPDKSRLLMIEFDHPHRISSVTPVGLTADELETIQRDIKDKLVDNQQDAIGQTVLLSGARIEGRFLYKQDFQIVPTPQRAPQVEHAFGEHPYMLQLRYKRSSDELTNRLRIQKRVFELVPIMNGISRTPFLLPAKYTIFRWGTLPTADNPTPEWFQVGYKAEGLELTNTVFDQSNPRVMRIAREEYYGNYANPNFPFVLPDNFELLLEKAFSLPHDVYQKLHRACMWLAMGREIWRISAAAAFVGVVSALESLIDRPEKCSECEQSLTEALEKCPKCQQPKYKITKSFMTFIETYIPRIAQKRELKKCIYKVRSGLAHGLVDPLMGDNAPWIFEHPELAEQEWLQQELFDCASEAIVNWLQSYPVKAK